MATAAPGASNGLPLQAPWYSTSKTTTVVLVYDIKQDPPDLFGLAIGFLLLGVAIYLYINRKNPLPERVRTSLRGEGQRTVGAVVLGLIGLALSCGTFSSYIGASQANIAGTAAVIEGEVEDYHPVLSDRVKGAKESFVIKGVTFSYAPSQRLGYNKTRYSGGFIRNGLYLRVHYLADVEHTIVRLEMREESSPVKTPE